AFLIFLGLSEQLGVDLLEADPFDALLIETEEASRAGSTPVHIRGKAEAMLFQNPDDVFADEAIFTEGVDRGDVRLVADVAFPILVCPKADVVEYRVIAHVRLEGLEFQHLRAPAAMVRRDHVTVYREPVVEAVPRGATNDGATKDGLQAGKVV